MFREKVKVLAAALPLLLPASCSVREDRGECPCWLEVFCAGCPEDGLFFSADAPDGRTSDWHFVRTDFSPSATVTVARRRQVWCSWADGHGIEVDGRIYRIDAGRQCDSLYSWHGGKDCRCESQKDTIVLHKQFCTVFLTLSNPGKGDYPFEIEVRGNSAGLDLISGIAVDGRFRFRPRIEQDRCSFRLPRQCPGSELTLAFYRDGEFLSAADLGNAMLESGYDWEDIDLEDVRLDIQYSRLTGVIKIEDWEDGRSWNTEI